MQSFFQDLRYGLRIFINKPGFTLLAVLSLALGIGANTAIFSLLDAVMLKSLPVQDPGRLVLFGKGEAQGLTNDFPDESWQLFSYPFYREVQRRNEVFTGVAALLSIPWTVHGTVNANGSSDEIEKINAQLVSGTYFSVLGVNASVGRTFSDGDDQNPGSNPVAVVSHAWWVHRLGGDPAAVGKAIKIDDVSYNIVGVAPTEFFGTTVGQAPDIWIPLAMEKQLPPAHWDNRNDPTMQSLFLIGRLKNGVSTQQANAAVNLLFKQASQELAGAAPSAERLQDIQRASIELTPVGRGLSELRTEFSLSLKILMGVVALVLFIACANVANLLLAHGAARRREFAVRLAVGAGRMRLVRQLLTESVLLATLGGLAGVVLAWWGSRILLLMASNGPEALPLDVAPNARILGFTFAASLLAAVVFGTAPALRAARVEPNSSLKGGRGPTRGSLQSPLGKALVVAQVALSLLLLVGAGLFLRTLINLQNVPTGYNQENAILFDIDTSPTGFKEDDPKLSGLLREVEEQAKVVPGVQAASFSFFVFNQGAWSSVASTSEQNQSSPESRIIMQNVVGPDFFAAMGIPIVAGRGFRAQDTQKSQSVAVISETMAQRFFPNSSPLGQRFGVGRSDAGNVFEVIGVVQDAKYGSLTEKFRPMAYYPHSQRPQPLSNLVVRFNGSAEVVIPRLRQTIKQVNRNLAIDEVVPLAEHIGRSLVQQKLVARLATFFGLLALLLACVGLYGVMSYAVARRTNEIGIRMALGAQGANVLWLVLRESLTLVLIGLVLGLLSSLASTKTAATLLFGLKPNDPLTITLASLLLIIVAVVACYLPAHRAARVDPMTALREE
jgi:predicted permease